MSVSDGDIAYRSSCSRYITTEESYNVAVQVISGLVPSCGPTTLLFHDGHKDNSEPQKLRSENNGMIWRSTGNSTHLIMNRNSYYGGYAGYGCMKIYLRVWIVPGRLGIPVVSLGSTNPSIWNKHIL